MANPLQELFEWFAGKRAKWNRDISGSDQIRRGDARDAAIKGFDQRLAAVLGHPLPKLKGSMSPTQRALTAAKTKDEATRIYDAAVAAAATKYGNTTGGRYKKAVKKYAAYRDKAVSRLDAAYATASGSGTGSVTGSPAGSTNSGSAPPPRIGNSLVQSSGGTSGDGGQNWFLWVGLGLLGLWYFKR